MGKLTDKQQRFIEEYLVDSNGKQAAIRAGYSEKTAEVQASRLLSYAKIKEAVVVLQEKTSAKLEITREGLLKDLINIVEDHKGKGGFPPHALRAIEMLLKAQGWNEPDKTEVKHLGITFNYVKPMDDKKDEES